MAQTTITTSTGADGVAPAANAVWATERGATTGGTGNATFLDRNDGGNYTIGRYFTFFDLGVGNIPAAATITAITFVFPIISSLQNADTDSVVLTAHTASDPPVGDDFNNITLNSPTSFGTETFANLSTVGVTNITMTADAITAAQAALGSVWKVCIRGNRDVTDAAPTGLNQFSFTIDDSQITITYTLPESGGMAFMSY